MEAQAMVHPATLDAAYAERRSRLRTAVQFLFGWLYAGIPHGVVLYIYGILAIVCWIFGFLGILFTGKYPKGLFDLSVGYYRWQWRLNSYLFLLTDKYPPFTNKP